MQNLTLVIFKKLENSRNNDEKSKSHIIFYYGFCEFLAFFYFYFVLL